MIIKGMEQGSGPVPPADLARVSPLAYAHVIPSGTYHFEGARPG